MQANLDAGRAQGARWKSVTGFVKSAGVEFVTDLGSAEGEVLVGVVISAEA